MVHTGRAMQVLLVSEINVPECPVWLGHKKIKALRKCSAEV